MAETDEYGIFSVLPCLLHSIITVGVIFRFGFERSWFHRLDGSGKLLTPTIKPTPGFSATADAERLHRAMKGAGEFSVHEKSNVKAQSMIYRPTNTITRRCRYHNRS